jgi:hypothetical protein
MFIVQSGEAIHRAAPGNRQANEGVRSDGVAGDIRRRLARAFELSRSELAPGIDGERVEGSEVGLVRVTLGLGLVLEIPDVLHENAADCVDCIVSLESASQEPAKRVDGGRQGFSQLVLDDHMGRGVHVQFGTLILRRR